jgi:dTDP-4-dehydrorhamnose reductase
LARKILITGASGLLGLALTLEARGRGLEVIALYHSTVIEVPGVQCIRLDLLDKSAVEDCVRSLHPELIVHAAAEVRVDWCEDHPAEAERINVGATEDLARLASEMGARFLYVSTDSVYDGRTSATERQTRLAPSTYTLQPSSAAKRQPSDCAKGQSWRESISTDAVAGTSRTSSGGSSEN